MNFKKSYSMEESLNVTNQGTRDILEFLNNRQGMLAVINVESIYKYRDMDIDLIIVTDNDKLLLSTIEIKVDRCYETGNYYFEYISNLNKNSLGCFMYSHADWLYYYYLNVRELHIMPFKKLRLWFMKNKERFEVKYTATSNYGSIIYCSKGYIVPRQVVWNEFKEVQIIKLAKEINDGR